MANEAQREAALDQIKQNIAESGHHIYVVSGGATPCFAYTVGISESIGVELILAGAVFYYLKEITRVINYIAAQLKSQRDQRVFEVAGEGSFTLREVHSSWAAEFMLGAFDYYQKQNIPALQIVPDDAHRTIDVPDMSAPWEATREPVWRWLREPWPYLVPKDATATTNLSALRGDRITEVVRWEEGEWEAFAGAGPDVPKDELRVVPLGVLFAADASLLAMTNLPLGAGLWRDAVSDWHPWGSPQRADDVP